MIILHAFRQSLRAGTGKACLIMRDSPSDDFSEEIRAAALVNHATDPQSEGSRAEYLARLIELAEPAQKDRIITAVLDAFEGGHEPDWNLLQLFDLAKIFCLQSRPYSLRAKKLIYRNYSLNFERDQDWSGEKEILEIDGLAGMLFIARKKGNRLLSDKEYWIDDFALYEFQQYFPDMDILQFLSKQSTSDLGLQKFTQEIKTILEKARGRPRHKRPTFNYQIVMERVNGGRRVPPSRLLSKELSDHDFSRLAENVLAETDPEKQLNLLRVFGCSPFPKGYQVLLPLAHEGVQFDDPAKNVRFIGYACDALGQFRADEIRQFALDKLTGQSFKSTDYRPNYIPLFEKNYQAGDEKLLAKIADDIADDDELHHMAVSLIRICRANPSAAWQKPLEIIYDKLRCGLHRQDIVKILHDNGVLSPRILEELPHDSYDLVREFCISLKKTG